jgi:hypothetical protein
VLADQQKFVKDGREVIVLTIVESTTKIGKVGVKGLDSGEGRDTKQREHSGVRIMENEFAQRQENIFVWEKGLHEGGV